jgi:FixJ family two-component response regulator
LEERAATLYYRSVVLAAKLASAPEDSKRHAKCALSLNATRKRLDSVRSRISRIRLDATNREIAAELGVPKGTIDSGLYFLRRKRGKNNPATPLTKNRRNRYSAP